MEVLHNHSNDLFNSNKDINQHALEFLGYFLKMDVIGVFIVNFEHISHLFLVFLLLTLTSKC